MQPVNKIGRDKGKQMSNDSICHTCKNADWFNGAGRCKYAQYGRIYYYDCMKECKHYDEKEKQE